MSCKDTFDLLILYNTECRTEGDKAVTIQLPEAYADDIVRLQSCMLDELAEKGIAIECNPTSNLKIGRFSHYIEHPIFAFHPIESDRRHAKNRIFPLNYLLNMSKYFFNI